MLYRMLQDGRPVYHFWPFLAIFVIPGVTGVTWNLGVGGVRLGGFGGVSDGGLMGFGVGTEQK
jgi:hypothetical protein